MQVTADTLKELEAGDIPQIIVYNKADKCEMEPLPQRDRTTGIWRQDLISVSVNWQRLLNRKSMRIMQSAYF